MNQFAWFLLFCSHHIIYCVPHDEQPFLEMSEVRSGESESDITEVDGPSPNEEEPSNPVDLGTRRIFNADEEAAIEDYPFMAAILMNGHLWCGGAIIGPDSILTAAHCLQLQYNNRLFREYMKLLTVRVGSSNSTHGGEVLRVTEIFFHPNYIPKTLAFNLAVLKLNKNLTTADKNREPSDGRLRSRDDEDYDTTRSVDVIKYYEQKHIPVNDMITFLGWGAIGAESTEGGLVMLQKVDLPVYHFRDCQEVYGRDLVTRNNFCAGYITVRKNVCNHDSGGPAIKNGRLAGILSFSHKTCDELDKPAVFTSIGSVLPWLENIHKRDFRGFMID